MPAARLPAAAAALSVLAVCLLSSCGGPSPASDSSCAGVQARASTAAAVGERLRAEPSTDSRAIETSARDYVGAVRSRPGCFTDAQRANAEKVGESLPSAPAS